MYYKHLHEWNLPLKSAADIQRILKKKLKFVPITCARFVSGVDLSFPKKHIGIAVIVTLDITKFEVVETAVEVTEIRFPYIPGFLTFREGPAFLKAWEKVSLKPDVVMFDGHGTAHPRGLGIACHLGLFIDLPTVGVAKSHLYGKYEKPSLKKGNFSYVTDSRGNILGAAVVTRDDVSPVFVSPGHLSDLDSSLDLTFRCTTKYKIPEPLRIAHNLTQKHKREMIL
ncbi:MAG: endonuclease V [Thermotogae bacterium]|nr:MAG: endonuclease V [Thermotogota bacterium]